MEPHSTASLTYADLSEIRAADPFAPDARRVVVVRSDVDFGVARMYEMIHGGPIRICRSVDEAGQHLGLDGH